MERIKEKYGDSLEEIEKNIYKIINDYFLDKDGYIYSCINKNTLLPFKDDDPEVNVVPIHKMWIANGGFPYDLKRTYMNYEDSDMAAGDYLMALMSKYQKTKDSETKNRINKLYQAMVKLYDTVAEKHPYGAGFLPKPYGGIDRASESFETSADQYFKFTVALEKYSFLTEDESVKKKISDILVSFAQWLDERDFVTPYMGYCNYGRLQHLQHYLGYFTYIMALGYKITGNKHFLQEALFFKERMINKGSLSCAPNALNLVVEIMDRLINLMPEYKKDWLNLMVRDWDNHKTIYMELWPKASINI